ncbi:RNA-binding protein, partial [Methylobacterium radiotolerans]
MSESLLQVRGLTNRYGARRASAHVSFGRLPGRGLPTGGVSRPVMYTRATPLAPQPAPTPPPGAPPRPPRARAPAP